MVINISICFVAYVLGSIPFGVLFARTQNINLREHGSKNIGATNAARILGKKVGVLTLIGDIFKGWLAFAIASWALNDQVVIAVAGLMAFLGHLFSIFLKFKGGKGVAIGLGIHLYIMPIATVMAIGVFACTLWVSRYVSLSSIFAAIVLPMFGILMKTQLPYIYMSLGIAILVLIKHNENIQRIIAGEEPYFLKN